MGKHGAVSPPTPRISSMAGEVGSRSESPAGMVALHRLGIVSRNAGRELMHLLFVLRGPKSKALSGWPSFWKSLRDSLLGATKRCITGGERILKCSWLTCVTPLRVTCSRPDNDLWILAVCHVHSEWSYDGSWSLPELAPVPSPWMPGADDDGTRSWIHGRTLEEYRQACAESAPTEFLSCRASNTVIP